MSHFIFTKEGVQDALGLSSLTAVDYYIKKAKKKGFKPSRIIGGSELFDIDMLLGKSITFVEVVSNSKIYTKDDLAIFATGHLF